MAMVPFISYWEEWEHLKCSCGGILGMYDSGSSGSCTCDRCGKQIKVYKCQYDSLLINNKTGWLFPMVIKRRKEARP